MSRIENNPSFGLIRQEGDRIVQYGLTVEQSKLLDMFLASLTREEPLVRLGCEYDLVLKEEANNE